MTKLPYMPLYVPDYNAATSWMSLEKDGLYMRALRLMWVTPGCSLPNDKDWLIERLHLSGDEYERLFLPIKKEFMDVKRGRIIQKRLLEEFEKVTGTSKARSGAGKKGVRAKRLKSKEKDLSPADDLLKQKDGFAKASRTRSISSKKDNKKGSRMEDDWVLPDEYRVYAIEQGILESNVVELSKAFRDHWLAKPGKEGVKLDWLAAWRTWVRNDIKWNGSAGKKKDGPHYEEFDLD